MFSCEFSKISKNTIFTEHLRTTASAFSFSEVATGGVLENFAKFTGKHLWFVIFSKTPFLQNTPGRLLLAFSCNVTKMWYCQQWKNSDEYSLPSKTNLRSTVQVYHFFLGSINFKCMLSLVYTVYWQKQPSE